MHTDPNDPYGQDINAILKDFELTKGQVLLSEKKCHHKTQQQCIIFQILSSISLMQKGLDLGH